MNLKCCLCNKFVSVQALYRRFCPTTSKTDENVVVVKKINAENMGIWVASCHAILFEYDDNFVVKTCVEQINNV